ncbi:sensor histidine kinase [Fusibacter ferrireducens]|uniref:sensor histidine kinase n=1 Tax=Fusibacter ferrireducens TaxID=2785058 RepID=UPI00188CF2C6|nr:ATP-binding protein [Fusibacter ferrireducens]
MATILELLVLLGYGYLVLKCPLALTAVTAILAISIMQVVNGIFQSIGSILCEAAFPHVTLVLVICSLMALAVIYFSYRYVIKTFRIRQSISTHYIGLLLLPILFILLVIQHIFMTYGSTIIVNSDGRRIFPNINDWGMLLIQVSAYFCLFAVVFAYRKLEDNFELQTQNALLEQQVNTQTHYMQEVQMRYDQTRAFRHDLKSHFMVLGSLIERTENQKAVAYLNKLDVAKNTFSFPCQTGNMVVDLLLSDKLGLAQQKGIKVECNMTIPSESIIDDMDLCIVFSNAIDNAINACEFVEEKESYIIISAVQKGRFFMIEIENSCNEGHKKGTGTGLGLKNIRAVAEKYNGAVSVDHEVENFKLNVLLLI